MSDGPTSDWPCRPARLGRAVLPTDGTSGFPTDGVVRVFLTGGFPAPLRSAIASEYRLRDASGVLVPLSSSVVWTRLDLRPRARLSPGQRYTLESVFAYDSAGVRVSDTERLEATASGATAGLRGAWFPVARFETGSGPSDARAVSAQIGRTYLHFGGSVGRSRPELSVSAWLTLPSNIAPTDVIELRVEGSVVDTQPALGAYNAYAGDDMCKPDPVSLPARSALDVELVVLDAASREIGTSGSVRADSARAPISPEWEAGRRSTATSAEEEALAARWVALQLVEARPAMEPAPASCPHGLEVTARREVAPIGGEPAMVGAGPTLTSDASAGWISLSYPGTTKTPILRITADGEAALHATIFGNPMCIGHGSIGPYLASTVFHSETGTSEISLHALALDGQTRWTRRLARADGIVRIASGGGCVLASFLHGQLPLMERAGRLGWAIFFETTGAAVRRSIVSARRMYMNEHASAFVRDHFLLAWPSAPLGVLSTISIATVGPDGVEIASRDLDVQCDGTLALASTGSHVALVSDNGGQVEWRLLDADGDVVRGPVIVSVGIDGHDNCDPRIAWNGEVFAVAWDTRPSDRTYVSVVDESGHVGPAVAFDPGVRTSRVGISAVGRTFLGTYTLDRSRVIVTALRCGASAPTGAPQRIAP